MKSLAVITVLLAAPPARAQTVPGPPPAPAPMVHLKAAYPYGEPLGCTVVPGNERAIVVQGATLTVVDLTTFDAAGEPRSMLAPGSYVEIPPVSSLALRYRLGAQGERSVYLAGGTAGLWKVDLCDALFTSSTPTTCVAAPEILDRVGCENDFVWKSCVDVAVIEGHFAPETDGLLVALYAASSDPRKRVALTQCPGDLGGTEVRAYRLHPTGAVSLHAVHLLDESGQDPQMPVEEVGTALAVDPADANVVYVAVGAGGVRRMRIGDPVPAVSAVPFPGQPACSRPNFSLSTLEGHAQYLGGPGCPAGERVRDLAIVHTPTAGSLLYALFDYGRVVEVQLSTGNVTGVHAFDVYFPQRIAAYADGDEVLVAVGLHTLPSVVADTAAPFRPTGLWTDVCVNVGLEDVNNLALILTPTGPVVNQLRVLARNASSPLAPAAGITPLTVQPRWNTLEFVPTSIPSRARLYASTAVEGVRGWRMLRTGATAWSQTDAWTGGKPYGGTAFAIGDPTVSLVNNELGGGGFDGWESDVPGRMFRIVSSGSTIDAEPIPNTISVCPARDVEFPRVKCSGNDPVLWDPRPFVLQSSTSSAQWRDPYDPTGYTEWFLSGGETSWRAVPPVVCADGQACSWEPDTQRCYPNPCGSTPACSSWGERRIPGSPANVGWNLVRLTTGGISTTSITGPIMNLAWWQLPANNTMAGQQGERSTTAPYTTSVVDPRTMSLGPNGVPVPRFLHLVRNGAKEGIRMVRTSWVLNRAQDLSLAACSSGSGTQGNGEPLGTPDGTLQTAWGPNSDLEMLAVSTHVELDAPGCEMSMDGLDCLHRHGLVFSEYRNAFNNKAHVFSVPDGSGGERWILATASGSVGTAFRPAISPSRNANCPWKDHYGRALTVFHDITQLNENQPVDAQSFPPTLLAVALGPDPATEPYPPHGIDLMTGIDYGPEVLSNKSSRASHAFAVKTKAYAQPGGSVRTLAFVGDLLGRIFVYDVSWDRLKPAAGSSYTAMPAPGNGSQPLLFPGRIHRFPAGAVDGWRSNCTDLELDLEVLYCAAVRDGVYLLEVGPSMPALAPHTVPPSAPLEGLPVYGVLDTAGMATGIHVRRPSLSNRQLDQLLVGDNRAGLLVFGRSGN